MSNEGQKECYIITKGMKVIVRTLKNNQWKNENNCRNVKNNCKKDWQYFKLGGLNLDSQSRQDFEVSLNSWEIINSLN